MSKHLIHRINAPISRPKDNWSQEIEKSILDFSQQVSESHKRTSHVKIKTISSDFTLGEIVAFGAQFAVIFADATNGNISVFFPPANILDSVVFTVKKIDSSANTVTLVPNGSETIDGQSSIVITDRSTTFSIASDGTNLQIY